MHKCFPSFRKTKMVSYLDDLELRSNIEKTQDEIKRLEHLILVSLKYTRTVDMLKEVVENLIETYEFIILILLEYLVDTEKIDEIPASVSKKCEVVKENIELEEIEEHIDLYLRMRKLLKTDYDSINEYRRHVTMKGVVEDKEMNIDIDTVTEYYREIKELFKRVKDLMQE